MTVNQAFFKLLAGCFMTHPGFFMIGALAPRVHGKGVPAAKLACNSMRPPSMSLDRLAVDVCAVDVEVPF